MAYFWERLNKEMKFLKKGEESELEKSEKSERELEKLDFVSRRELSVTGIKKQNINRFI